MPARPRFASSLTTLQDSGAAASAAVAELQEKLGDRPDLLVVFVSHHHGAALEDLGPRLAAATSARVLAGCTGEGIIGSGREVEREPALALFGAVLPDTDVRPFRVTAHPGKSGAAFEGGPSIEEPDRAGLILLADPFSFPAAQWLELINEQHPGVPVMGGMASGGHGPGQNLLITASGLRADGAIGLVLEGQLEMHPVVSQGCRPVGRPWVVTDCEDQLLRKLGGRKALDVLLETLHGLPEAEQELFKRAPFIGLATDPHKSRFERADFLVRGILGFQPQEHAIAVADTLRRGQTVQFLVRDAKSAGQDLDQLLAARAGGTLEPGEGSGAGALLFSCNGRGSHMFDVPDHDVGHVRAALHPDLPVAGFFAMGEIGPVGRTNHVHGFTASVAVLRPRA